MGSVDIVVPNTPEAETKVAMMNKQLPAYLTFYLEDQGLDKEFIRKLLTRSWCTALIHKISYFEWNKSTKVLTTSGEIEEQENSADIDSSDCYRYEVGNHMVDNKKRDKILYAATDDLYDLNGDYQ